MPRKDHPAICTKSATVLKLTHQIVHPNKVAVFKSDGLDEDARATELLLDEDVWDDMNQPRTVTVTVEPGDQLNSPTPFKPACGHEVDDPAFLPPLDDRDI